jgi:hypothetical protein
MGFVKLFKADRTFDLLPADDIISVATTATTIVFKYSTGTILTVAMSSVESKDAEKIMKAALKIEGASGEGIAPEKLSVPITSVSKSKIT